MPDLAPPRPGRPCGPAERPASGVNDRWRRRRRKAEPQPDWGIGRAPTRDDSSGEIGDSLRGAFVQAKRAALRKRRPKAPPDKVSAPHYATLDQADAETGATRKRQ